MGSPESWGLRRAMLLSSQESKSIQLRDLETTGQMKRLKKKDGSSRENVPRRGVNWPSGVTHLHLVSSALYRRKWEMVFMGSQF